jgi:hypothetical protein
MMYKRAGVSMKSLGYGRSLRPYLDVNHENGTNVEIDSEGAGALGISPAYSGDEWTYSRAAVTNPISDDELELVRGRDLTDTYSFTILGDTVKESVTAESPDSSSDDYDHSAFVSVGMVGEWLGSFKKKLVTGAAANIDEDNALLQLRSQQAADKEEVLELAAEGQTEGRPWDLDAAQFKLAVYQGFCKSSGSESSYLVFNAPCGLFNLTLGNESTAETLYADIEVLDIRDM